MSVMRCLAACLVVFAVSSCVLAQTARFTMLEAAPDWDDLVRPSVVMAEVLTDTPAYSSWDGGGSRTCTFHAGETVEVVRDHGFQWYLIRAGDGREGWVRDGTLAIPSDPETNSYRLPRRLVEEYVNVRGFTSKTDQLVWVDLDRQLTHVFTGGQGSWELVRTMLCATGRNISPTIRGLHEIAERGEWFYVESSGQGAENWVRFHGPYLFHGLPMDKEHTILDLTLGQRRSAGCIRLSMEDARWFYSFIKRGTTVFVY